jgi:hypothetical protein
MYKHKIHASSGWWIKRSVELTPVIVTTPETEIRRVTVWSQQGKEFMRPYLKKKNKITKKRACWSDSRCHQYRNTSKKKEYRIIIRLIIFCKGLMYNLVPSIIEHNCLL